MVRPKHIGLEFIRHGLYRQIFQRPRGGIARIVEDTIEGATRHGDGLIQGTVNTCLAVQVQWQCPQAQGLQALHIFGPAGGGNDLPVPFVQQLGCGQAYAGRCPGDEYPAVVLHALLEQCVCHIGCMHSMPANCIDNVTQRFAPCFHELMSP